MLDTLFVKATFHAFAKLRLHTSTTLRFFDKALYDLGTIVRDFDSKVCPHYETRPLAGKEATRKRAEIRREQAKAKKAGAVAEKAANLEPTRAKKKTSTRGGGRRSTNAKAGAYTVNKSIGMSTSGAVAAPASESTDVPALAAPNVADAPGTEVPAASKFNRLKNFNLSTPKWHLLVHYPDAIRRLGPTDNYSTRIVRPLRTYFTPHIC
jgi:hypothetical protein